MHKRFVVLLGIMLLTMPLSPRAADLGGLPSLPDSLSQWYKPQNQRQVWLHTMFSLRRELQAVQEYAAAGDGVHLAKWAGRLAAHYRKLGVMVPEWSDELELGEADALAQAAESGDVSAAAQSARRLARTCRSCHREYRALAAARFRAPDFAVVSTSHGEASLTYAQAMEALSRSVNRIKIAADDSRWEAATEALKDLRSRLDSLGGSCNQCHRDEAPRERILGVSSRETLNDLAQALAAHDQGQTGRLLGGAAVQVCARCHGVHRTLSDLRQVLFE
jgi:cytochrome c556